MGPMGFHLLVSGSYISPVFRCSVPSWPPTAYSFPGRMDYRYIACIDVHMEEDFPWITHVCTNRTISQDYTLN